MIQVYKGILHSLHKNSFSILTSFVTFDPNSQPAPLGLMAHVSTLSGSDQTRCEDYAVKENQHLKYYQH